MDEHGGYLAARTLKNEGVEVIFTLCGGHIAPIYDGCIDVGIKVVDVRHEQSASHAADAWARVTGKPGVAVVTAGPGVTDAFTGVVNAQRNGSPMLLIGGQGPFFEFDMGSLQETDHVEIMRPVTKWSRRVLEARRIPEYVATAFRYATSGKPGPVFLEIPIDILMNRESVSATSFPENYRTEARPAGDPRYVERAAEVLARAERPVVMAGTSVWWCRAWEPLADLLEAGDIPAYVNGMARGCLPPKNPRLLAHSRKFALANADAIFLIGSPLDFRLSYGRRFSNDAKIVQIDMAAEEIGHNRGADIGIPGDVAMILSQLLEALRSMKKKPVHTDWIDKLRSAEEQGLAAILPHLNDDSVPINPFRLCKEIAEFVDRDTIVVGDGGDIVAQASKVIEIERPGHWIDPGPFGCLGVGMPFAIAAKLARPKERVLIVYGDGSFGLNGFEYDTAVRYNLPIIGVIGNDAAWGQIRRPQIAMFGEDRAVGSALAFTRYDKIVEALGGYGEYVEDPAEILPALRRAEESGKPALVNVKINPAPVGAEMIKAPY